MKDEYKPDLALIKWLELVIPENIENIREIVSQKPYRITQAYKQLFSGYETKSAQDIITITEEISDNSYTGLVSGLNIHFMSFCAHHFLPFSGKVDVIYEPNNLIIGIGKLSRIVDYRTKRFNIQENIAKEIAEDLMNHANAKGAFVRVRAKHSCLCYRGPTKYDSENVIIYSTGSCTNQQSNINLILEAA